jgi:hypothetical protein
LQIKDYRIINSIFIGILILMFGYAFFFAYNNHSVTCVYVKMYNKPCPTCGITRAFSEILHFNFAKASTLNNISLKFFGFFFVQLILRFIINVFCLRKFDIQKIINFDVAFSILLFVFCFFESIKFL